MCHQTYDINKPLANNLHWWSALLLVVATSFGTRFYKVEEPASVVWDESHFGKMGTYYINHTFFFDVHPPLGKMLIGLSGLMTGYSGNFDFNQPGDDYPIDMNYMGMRKVCACFGSLVPIFCFSIVWNVSKSINAALLAAFLVILDTAVLTVSRFILLDPFLLCFIMAATWAHVQFGIHRERSFGLQWWLWLSATGFFFALAIGVKFVGLFVIILIGMDTFKDLWELLGDLSLSKMKLLQHLLARACCLILLPLLVYLTIFAAHFHILENSGSGEGFFSSAFQSRLKGNPLYNASMPEDVAYGSAVTIKSSQLGGAYLHSHAHLYPEGVGARQQQVTGYSHKDGNNYWKFKLNNTQQNDTTEVTFVIDGDVVRIEHALTQNNLHSHVVEAPVTRDHYQVTCYGNSNGQGDSNDMFQLHILDNKGLGTEALDNEHEAKHLKTLRSKFRLIHVNTGCALQSHTVVLPKWGFEQFEVSCNPHTHDQGSMWNIEQTFDERLQNVSFDVMVPSFLENVIESHAVMLRGNSGLKPKEGDVYSVPWQWPLNYRGQSKFYVGEYTIYMLGNPVIWWFCLASLVLFLIWYCVIAILRQRKVMKNTMDNSPRVCLWLFLGWALHYAPFWLMSRVLYFHHYFSAFLYSAMLAAVFIDYVVQKCVFCSGLPVTTQNVVTVLLLGIFAHSFYMFSPLCYGITGKSTDIHNTNMAGLQWLSTWEF